MRARLTLFFVFLVGALSVDAAAPIAYPTGFREWMLVKSALIGPSHPARFASTGGWGFERFMHGREEERALGEGGGAKCYDCHKKQETAVFSVLRD
jgi:hypothetical protein